MPTAAESLEECLFAVWPPKVESVEELDQVLAELGRIERKQKSTQSALAEKLGALTTEAAAELVVELPGREEEESPLSFADWKVKLEQAAEKFCNKNRDKILDEGRKSRKLNHGKFGWEKSRPALEPLEDFPASGNDKILKGLLAVLRQALLKAADFVTGGSRFVEVELSWRKKDLLKAYDDGDIKVSVLRQAGFQVREETDEFFLKPEIAKVEALEG